MKARLVAALLVLAACALVVAGVAWRCQAGKAYRESSRFAWSAKAEREYRHEVIDAALAATVGVLVKEKRASSASLPSTVRVLEAPVSGAAPPGPLAVANEYFPELLARMVTAYKVRYGAGVVIERPDIVLTSARLVVDAERVELLPKEGGPTPGRVIGIDRRTGLAIVRADEDLWASIPARRATPAVGDKILVIGSPLGLPHSVTWSTVAATDRGLAEAPDVGTIQIDGISLGYEGGPAFTESAGLVGIVLNWPVGVMQSHPPPGGHLPSRAEDYLPSIGFVIPVDAIWDRILELLPAQS